MIERQSETTIPTPYGKFRIVAYSETNSEKMPHMAIISENADYEKPMLIRIHSECLTGDIFGSKRCDCGPQLDKALELAAQQGGGVIYMRQEGRGIGIINKLKAYNLQDQGQNTAEANASLGLPVDGRNYDDVESILKDLGIKEIKLLTNNPAKIEAMQDSDIKVLERVPIIIEPVEENKIYLKTKTEIMGHMM